MTETSARIRTAVLDDDQALTSIDDATWSSQVSPAPAPEGGHGFFRGRTVVDEVLVAELDGRVAGYVAVRQGLPIPSHDHVLEVAGLAVDPGSQGRGVGQTLMDAAVDEARRRGARKLTLRVLGHNQAARRLYERCGFRVEGVLVGEFQLDGADVDDVLMAVDLT